MYRTNTRLTRTLRTIAASAFVLSLSLTSLAGSAAASPAADETKGCSVLAHERNESVHRLHEAWKDFRDELKDLLHEARDAQHAARKADATTKLTIDVRDDLSDARAQLNAIWTKAHAELQDKVELGTACKDSDDHGTTSETEQPVDVSVQTKDLVKKYRDVVDQAIKDMQAVMDEVKDMVTEMLSAAATEDPSDAATAKDHRAKAKDKASKRSDKEHGKQDGTGRPDGAGKGSRP